MGPVLSLRLQTVLVAILFLGSVAALVFNVFTAVVPRARELAVRQELQGASRRMAEAGAEAWSRLQSYDEAQRDVIDRTLAAISEQALASYPDCEGGFYLDSKLDRFSGFGQGSGKPRPPDRRLRNDPPPLEAPLIRVQAQQSLDLAPGEFLLNIRDVGPSRVAVMTEPVGAPRPAPLATWVMYRLVDPRDLGAQVRRYQLSTMLALGGLGSAMLLAWNLNRLIRRQNVEREHLQLELRRSEHLAALGTMLSSMAHEVRNPLAAIRSTVQLWQRLPQTAHSPSSVGAVVTAVDRINQIISQLLQFSRTSGDERELVDVNQLLRETLELVAAQAESQGVTIERSLAGDPLRAQASPQALRQVFLNLVANALQAMPQGGVLRCHSQRANGTLAVLISDSGSGISSEVRAHLFEPFFTTRAEGTGLGLAICREIVTQHGGRIELVEGAGPGAAFRVTLPVAA